MGRVDWRRLGWRAIVLVVGSVLKVAGEWLIEWALTPDEPDEDYSEL